MKRIVTLFTVIILVVMMISAPAFAQNMADIWDGSIDTSWYDDNPTATSFEINTAKELAGLSKIVDDRIDSFSGKKITLMQDLDLASRDWNPIGSSSSNFEGIFDGNNYTISNITIVGETFLGLFAGLGIGGGILDLGLLNVNIATARYNAGGLVGGILDDATIKNCYIEGGNITSSGNNTGGLVGFTTSDIINSYADIEVSGGQNVGGLVGLTQNITILNSFAKGNISGNNYIGGLLGCAYNGVNIENSYATGTVTATGDNAGGLFGGRNPLYSTGTVNITNSYGNNANEEKGEGTNGNQYIVGSSGATLSQMRQPAFRETLSLGDVRYPFGIDANFSGGYPYIVTIPQIMSGDNQTIKQGDILVIETTSPHYDNAETEMITEVDGKAVALEMVSYEEGSTIMTLSGGYTSTLPVGTYTISIGNDEFGVARGTFAVIEASDEDEETAPQTGDNSNLLGMFLVMGASVMGFATVKKKK